MFTRGAVTSEAIKFVALIGLVVTLAPLWHADNVARANHREAVTAAENEQGRVNVITRQAHETVQHARQVGRAAARTGLACSPRPVLTNSIIVRRFDHGQWSQTVTIVSFETLVREHTRMVALAYCA